MKRTLSIALFMLVAMGNMSGSVIGHTGKYWTVTEHDRSYKVGRESIDGTLRHVNKDNLARFLQKGRISANKTSDGSYVLRGYVHGKGGGPVTGWLLYWGTKAVCYGTAVAASGAAVVATGGLAGALTGGGVALAGAGVSTGTGVVAGVVAGAGFTGEAVAITTSSVAAFGGVGGAIAAVESAATGLGLWGLALPLP